MFATLSFLTSLVNLNFDGTYIAIFLIGLITIIMYSYKYLVDENLFKLLIKLITISSLVVAFIGIIQYIFIIIIYNHHNIFKISDDPHQRVSSVFGNANYYATIIEFVIIICVYKLMNYKDNIHVLVYYLVVFFINCLMLYLTGCRTSWIAISVAIPFMFIFKKIYHIGVFLVFLEFFGLIVVLIFGIFPRLVDVGTDIHYRLHLWITSLRMFLSQPFFGVGGHGYILAQKKYGGPIIAHSHSLYVEALLDFGIIGSMIFLIWFFIYFRTYLKNSHIQSFALTIGLIIAVLIHGILDVTVLNYQIALLLGVLMNSIWYEPRLEPVVIKYVQIN